MEKKKGYNKGVEGQKREERSEGGGQRKEESRERRRRGECIGRSQYEIGRLESRRERREKEIRRRERRERRAGGYERLKY